MAFTDEMMNNITPYIKPYARYTDKNGNGIPSVTEILSYIDNEGLIAWANMIGRKGKNNNDILKKAAEYGTNTHAGIESIIKNNQDEMFICNASVRAFMKWWDKLNKEHTVEVIGQEEPMQCPLFAGTYDLLIKLDDSKIVLVDFKTSNNVTYKYFMQLAAYRHLLYVCKGINIHGCEILHLHKTPKPKYDSLTLDFTDNADYNFIEHCFNSFIGIVYTYHHTENLKLEYNKLFG